MSGVRSGVRIGFLLVFALAACKKAPPPEIPPAALEMDLTTPRADRVLEEDDGPPWLLGTWKEEGKDAWLLFNPGEVAELAGKPVRVVRKGKLKVRGKHVAGFFEGSELRLEGSTDGKELATEDIRHVYRRGTPP
jgi:hypothetical protein